MPRRAMAAEASSAATILVSSHFGYSLSTTHVATGSILGTGVGKRGAEVRWRLTGTMALAWILTWPAAGAVGAASFIITDAISDTYDEMNNWIDVATVWRSVVVGLLFGAES